MSQKFENQKVTRILSRDLLEKKNLSKNMLNWTKILQFITMTPKNV